MRILPRSLGVLLPAIFFLVAGARAQLPPPVEREFRGLWVATVDNIDWPSKTNLTTRQQKAELIAIMDKAAQLRMNAIVLQVRPACDALYDSKIEPWSMYLTGKMGRPPRPYYDPLAFAVKEAHRRGLELHAWFNPYRALLRTEKPVVSPGHVSLKHPELVRRYGKYLWLDPTEPATRAYSLSVIMDVVRRYDIDGVHFDDYFYPYPEKLAGSGTNEMEFPDDATWARYQTGGGKMSRADWRRDNVNQFVQALYGAIKLEKPWVKFGISPFGIWQPGHPEGIAGFDAYHKLFCDAREWLAQGWVDYLAPQLYWPITQKAQSFPVLLKWWEEQNPQHRLICPGMRVEGWKGVRDFAAEATNEILLTRTLPDAGGQILWHSKTLFTHPEITAALAKDTYSEAALVPACPWLSTDAPVQPALKVKKHRRKLKLYWREVGTPRPWQWVVRTQTDGHWTTEIFPGIKSKVTIKLSADQTAPDAIAVSAVNRYGNLSDPAIVTLR